MPQHSYLGKKNNHLVKSTDYNETRVTFEELVNHPKTESIQYSESQRALNEDKVESMIDEYIHFPHFLKFKNRIVIAILNGRWYLVDGQHRLSALKKYYKDTRGGRQWDDFIEWKIPAVIFGLRAEKSGRAPSILEVVRNIFIYINKEAKPPTRYRNILLSDNSVNCILTQELLEVSHANDVKEKNEREKKLLLEVQAFNVAMCQKLEELATECLAQNYLIPPVGLSKLACSDDSDDSDDSDAGGED